ncbi:hypothetical protein MAR_019069 [Mya arenaria]|uniref:Hexosyltransferase n=1 Tax=Mya arenaria TaxID=6604 RepID=A0ABY7EK23_MYAAR|nr:hypothetical protein MAR_019069 [Mya arenaria]
MNSRFFRQRFPKYVLVVGVLLVFIWIYSEIVNEALFSVNNAHIADTVEDILHHVKFDGKPSVKADVVESVCRQEKGNMDSEEPLCQKPPILDPMYRNPCWSSKGELECVPYFLVTGMPYGRMEEVFYDLLGHKDITDYADEAAEHGPIEHRTAVYGDYLYMDEADEEDSNTDNQQRGNRFLDLWRLQHVNPDIKIIVVLKDPVERGNPTINPHVQPSTLTVCPVAVILGIIHYVAGGGIADIHRIPALASPTMLQGKSLGWRDRPGVKWVIQKHLENSQQGLLVVTHYLQRGLTTPETDRMSPTLTDHRMSPTLTDHRMSPTVTDLRMSPTLPDLRMSPTHTDLRMSPTLPDLRMSPTITDLRMSPTHST